MDHELTHWTRQTETNKTRAEPNLGRRGFLCAGATAFCATFLNGCRSANKTVELPLPARHSVQADQLVILSDFRLDYDHPLISDLIKLRKEVAETLNLEFEGPPVVVYLFADERKYYDYLKSSYPELPPRRAYFIGTSHELAVYTYWGDRIQEDLRHEFTHGLLHSTLRIVPLWLDEGIAEYFEVVARRPGTLNTNSVQQLSKALKNGWRPNMSRLETLEDVSEMKQADYQESWAWVHFMLHSSPLTKETLLTYLQDLRTDANPGELSDRLAKTGIATTDRIGVYITSLTRHL
jgi:hypothetical protein